VWPSQGVSRALSLLNLRLASAVGRASGLGDFRRSWQERSDSFLQCPPASDSSPVPVHTDRPLLATGEATVACTLSTISNGQARRFGYPAYQQQTCWGSQYEVDVRDSSIATDSQPKSNCTWLSRGRGGGQQRPFPRRRSILGRGDHSKAASQAFGRGAFWTTSDLAAAANQLNACKPIPFHHNFSTRMRAIGRQICSLPLSRLHAKGARLGVDHLAIGSYRGLRAMCSGLDPGHSVLSCPVPGPEWRQRDTARPSTAPLFR
jgi:hypothetical protein